MNLNDGNIANFLVFLEKANKIEFEYGELRCFRCHDMLDEMIEYGVFKKTSYTGVLVMNRSKWSRFCKRHNIVFGDF